MDAFFLIDGAFRLGLDEMIPILHHGHHFPRLSIAVTLMLRDGQNMVGLLEIQK